MAKPAKKETPNDDPKARATANLQYALDRAANYLHDGGTSYARRARTAAKAGVDRAIVEQGLDALEGALKDARAKVAQAYDHPEKVPTTSRVRLGA